MRAGDLRYRTTEPAGPVNTAGHCLSNYCRQDFCAATWLPPLSPQRSGGKEYR